MTSNAPTLGKDFVAARAQVIDALKEEGFGVLTEVDVTNTLKEKLDVDFRRYHILGACNPKLAHAALQIDLDVGMMMPCNVILYESDEGELRVKAVDPTRSAEALGNDGLRDFAVQVRDKLARVLERLS